ncbi:MAG: hypothetical protein SFU25_07715 [Candidatus Caenarcaniphilales bacterium]|nr:hypothetical protein [Candidatus Caenarcaniphilales bacterium]
MMKKLFQIVFLCTLLSACSQADKKASGGNYGNLPTVSKAHQEVISKVAQKPAPKGNSWKGHWMFSITSGDGHWMKDYTVLSKNTLEPNGKFIKSETVKLEDLGKDEFLHAGFITFDDASKGYDLTGYGKVKIPYTGFKAKGNDLEWDFSWFPAPADKRNYYAQEYHRVAKYDPEKDIIYGTCSMIMYKLVPGKNKKTETVVIPIGEYVWKATRLSEEDFQNIANKGGERNPNMPNAEYTVYVDTKHPKVQRLIQEQLNLDLEQRIQQARRESRRHEV